MFPDRVTDNKRRCVPETWNAHPRVEAVLTANTSRGKAGRGRLRPGAGYRVQGTAVPYGGVSEPGALALSVPSLRG